MDHVRMPKVKQTRLSAEQKAAFVLLMFLGIGGVILGFLSFGSNVRRPFDLQVANALKESDETFLLSSEREEQELEAQKTRDTDGDGLMDYDELYVFKTSPYLADSDSDGFDDRTEIFSNNDPNCPRGKNCVGIVASEDAVNSQGSSVDGLLGGSTDSTFSEEEIAAFEGMDFSSPEEIMSFFQSFSADQIRQALLESGLPEESLADYTDEQLQQLFLEAVEETSATVPVDETSGETQPAP